MGSEIQKSHDSIKLGMWMSHLLDDRLAQGHWRTLLDSIGQSLKKYLQELGIQVGYTNWKFCQSCTNWSNVYQMWSNWPETYRYH